MCLIGGAMEIFFKNRKLYILKKKTRKNFQQTLVFFFFIITQFYIVFTFLRLIFLNFLFKKWYFRNPKTYLLISW